MYKDTAVFQPGFEVWRRHHLEVADSNGGNNLACQDNVKVLFVLMASDI